MSVEYYIALWDSIGHLLHAMLLKGIRDRCFSSVSVQGVIVLLPKSGNFRLLNNGRPITLLNSMFKICSKHYQMLLAKVCIEFISPYQSTFIPGRTIHHALLLTIEAIHKARLVVENFCFMKLDIHKAFDSLEWDFLFAVLESFGFGPKFISYICASTMGAASNMLLNGRFTTPFPILRSIRQGCPLSTFLFVMVMEILSNMLSRAIANGHLHGVTFPELEYQIIHGIYADDIHMILEDQQQEIEFYLGLFIRFGEASGL